jgi:GT2 family glycosyltransferase
MSDVSDAGGAQTVQPPPPQAHAAASTKFDGFVEVCGFSHQAGGWYFVGWVRQTFNGSNPLFMTASFRATQIDGKVEIAFFERTDLAFEGVGFVAFIHYEHRIRSRLTSLVLKGEFDTVALQPVSDLRQLTGDALSAYTRSILLLCKDGGGRSALQHLVATAERGFIESLGFSPLAEGWFICGWTGAAWRDDAPPPEIVLSFRDGDIQGPSIAVLYGRAELPPGAYGSVFFLSAPDANLGPLISASFTAGDQHFILDAIADMVRLSDAELIGHVRSFVEQSAPGTSRDYLKNLASRRRYAGQDTLDSLAPNCFLHVDGTVQCGSEGIVLLGWMLTRPGQVKAIHLFADGRSAPIDPTQWFPVVRPDVLEKFGKFGFDDPQCGFIAYIPLSVSSTSKLHITVESTEYEVAYGGLGPALYSGMAGIKHLLDAIAPRFEEIPAAFDRVLGPAVSALNRSRLAASTATHVIDYGSVPSDPRYSIIVPLYGRIDFLEYQLALFSKSSEFENVELIYVLDDPRQTRQARELFRSAYARFRLPFRAVLLDRNLGYAPANNIGLRYATGEYLVYLNSDVFPRSQAWLEPLSARLEETADLGIVGPLLVFEDGSVQHRGIHFERLESFGGWYFPQHTGKGQKRDASSGLIFPTCITGACMMLRRSLAEQLNGFDQTYVIGDFEDTDLCFRASELGLHCAVDPMVELYHLERKSQLAGAHNWRTNLTIYNAWQHQRRWHKRIEGSMNDKCVVLDLV